MKYLRFFFLFLLIIFQVILSGVDTRSIATPNEQLENEKELTEGERDLNVKGDSDVYYVDSRTVDNIKSRWNAIFSPVQDKLTEYVSTNTL